MRRPWPFFRRRPQADFSREIESHLTLEIDRLVQEGLDPEDARQAARRRFGSVLAAEERFHESGRALWLDHLRKDLTAAVRSLWRYPIASLVGIISFAGAIGASTTTLLVREVVFHRPPALYQSPSDLSLIELNDPERPLQGSPAPGVLYDTWSRASHGATLAAASSGPSRAVRAGTQTVDLEVRSVTPSFFDVLGVRAAFGRTLSASDTTSVVVSYRVWQYLFDARPDAIGDTMWIDNQPYTLTGVMPERFWFSTMEAQAWRLFGAGELAQEPRVEVVGRRNANVSPSLLADALRRDTDAYAATLPSQERQVRVRVEGIEGTPMGKAMSLAFPFILGACVLLTTLIACANVAILVIAQWTAREQEISIRAALGASRRQIVRLLLTESMLLSTIGGVLGVCVTFALRGLIVWRAGQFVRFYDLSIPPSLLLESLLITMGTGILSGLGPALLETRRLVGNPISVLRTSERVRQRWRHVLVISEISVTVALLVVTAGMIDSYERQQAADVGYPTHPLLMVQVENPRGVPLSQTTDAIGGVPGVAAVSASTSVPYLGVGPLQRMSPDATGSITVRAERATIGADFFGTLGVPIRRGRSFNSGESPASHAVIVNETLASRMWAGRDPIGQRLWIEKEAYDVVGVVADYRNTPLQAHVRDPKAFVPVAVVGPGPVAIRFLVRASGDPAPLVSETRTAIRDAAAGNAVGSAATLDQIIDTDGQERLVGTAPLVPLIGTAMFLTAAGIYGVLAFAITRRSRELAVRVAMGATGRDLMRLVSAHSLRLVGIGSAIGIGATFALSRIVRAAGGGGSVLDPSLRGFIIPAIIVFVVAAVATWVPSRRAARVSPADLLRTS